MAVIDDLDDRHITRSSVCIQTTQRSIDTSALCSLTYLLCETLPSSSVKIRREIPSGKTSAFKPIRTGP